MPSPLHEAIVLLFRSRPSLALDLLRALDVEVPDHDRLVVGSETMRTLRPVEIASDAVIVVEREGPRLALAVEVQLGVDEAKRLSWPAYVVLLRRDLACPVLLLVIALDEDVARWCAQPIEMGHPGFTLRPVVIGPSAVPRVIDEAQAVADVEHVVLSALAHGHAEDDVDAVRVALHALQFGAGLDDDRRRAYADMVRASLSAAARAALEEHMKGYVYQDDFAKKYVAEGRAEGRVEGEAHALLTFLAARGLVVSAELEARVRACTDVAQLDRWIARAAVAATIDQVFEDG